MCWRITSMGQSAGAGSYSPSHVSGKPNSTNARISKAVCGGLNGAGAQTPPPDPSITIPCPRPEAFLGAGDWEIIAGRIGDALIDCGENHQALVDRDAALRGAM